MFEAKLMRYVLTVGLIFLLNAWCHADVQHDVQHDEHYLQGYSENVNGEELSYWNFHPLAKKSLLTRCTTGEMAISWKTEPMPLESDRDTVSFLWIGAFSTGTSTADHEFSLSVNGVPALTFHTYKGGKYDNWTVEGLKGVSLSYKHVWTDHVNDAHGYFCLRVPKGSYPVGQPLKLQVLGQKADSRDWYMTFMYAVKESAVVRPLPFLFREWDLLRQQIEVSVDSPADTGTMEVWHEVGQIGKYPLRLGWNAVTVPVNFVTKDLSMTLQIRINGGTMEEHTITLKPVKRRTLWLLPHSHNDIGYSDVQTTVLDIQVQNIRDALRLIEKTKEYPEGSRFKWNVEILWPIDSFLVRSTDQERAQFVLAVKNGDIGLNALYVNPLTGITRPEALLHMTDYARDLERKYGFQIPAAMVSDIPGYIWSFVPALARGGVRYLTCGPNTGDRIGHFLEQWGDKPFYWVGPSRKDSVLFWVAGSGYSFFHATRTFESNTGFTRKIQEYLDRLDTTGYPYDMVQMRYSIYSDNGMTDSTMSDFVRQWNQQYISPVLRIATADEMCIEFEKKYGKQLPSYAGDLTPYWEDGAISSAAELGLVQKAAERILQAEIVTAMINPKQYDRSAFTNAWNAVNLWYEHTWGAWNSVSDPDNTGVIAQWKIKRQFAYDAERQSKILLAQGLESNQEPVNGEYEVINTTAQVRTDLVIIDREVSRFGDRVVDEKGEAVPSQRLTDGRLAFLASNVPPFASSRFRVLQGSIDNVSHFVVDGWTMQNAFIRIAIDSTTGAIKSIYDLGTGKEYCHQNIPSKMNALIAVNGTDPADRSEGTILRIRVGEKGPLVNSFIIESSLPGTNGVTREITLIDGVKRVDIRDVIDKKAVREKEAVYFGFDFDIADPVTRFDLGWGYIRPEQDQLPGSCKDFFSVQRWVDISNEKHGITWATVEAPLVSLGELVDERHHNEGPSGWKTESRSSSTFYSWVMNNYWHTNYKADQEGKCEFHYSIKPHGEFDAGEAYRFGIERNQPLLVRSVQPGAPPVGLPFSLVPVNYAAITITSIAPISEGNAFLVRLYNPSPIQAGCTFMKNGDQSFKIFNSSLKGERDDELLASFSLDPFEVRTVRIELE